VLVDDQPVKTPSAKRTVVFQEYALFHWKTVRGNIEFGLICQGLNKKRRHLIVNELIAKMRLAGFEESYPHQLSGGMKQRVSIARALAVKPQIILMDEPFAAVDSLTRDFLQEELLRWQTELKLTIIFVTHNIDEAIFLGDRIAILSHRPARIKQILDVPFIKPRSLEIKNSPEFLALRYQVWQSLK
jgi:NitT/TauT family transport system ATP-binding protein